MNDSLCLLCVHAHPDDESSKGAASVAKYHAEGVNCVLVCCTGGEEGEILNPAMANPETLARLPEVRAEELARAAEVIGYDEVVMLGYRDSGMPGTGCSVFETHRALSVRPRCAAARGVDKFALLQSGG